MTLCVIHGHRGARGIAPENTLAGFSRACALGVDGLELDILISADERVVIHHDARLNTMQTRDLRGHWLESPPPRIRELTTTELAAFDVGRARPGSSTAEQFPQQLPADGERIPLLTDLAAWWHGLPEPRPVLNIELKSHPESPQETPAPRDYARIVLAELKAANLLNHAWLQAFDWRVLQEIQAQCCDIPTGYLSCARDQDPTIRQDGDSPWLAGFDPLHFGDSLPQAIKTAGGAFWGPWFGDLSRDRVREAHELGLRVHVWTLNEAEHINRALNWGVDGITTDYPDRAREIFLTRGIAVASPGEPDRDTPVHP